MKITIGIPTIAGREGYLRHCLQTCVSQDDTDLDILVSDNSAGNAEGTVRAFSDPRIRYIRPPHYLPMSRHWDFMLNHMTGDLVTVIGDDDGMMPNALLTVRKIISTYGLKPLQHTIAHYHWPDIDDRKRRNTFWFHHLPNTEINVVPSHQYLSRLSKGELGYIDGPMVYHNFIPRRLLCCLQRNGFIFHRSSPDVYSAVTIALNSVDFISTGHVLTIAGEGVKSNGAQCRDGGKEAEKFIKDAVVVEDKVYFHAHAVALSTLDAIFEASFRYDRPDIRATVEISEFYALAVIECLAVRNPKVAGARLRRILRDVVQLGIAGKVLRAVARRIGRRALSGIRSLKHDKLYWRTPRNLPANVGDVFRASIFLANFLHGSRTEPPVP